MNILLTGQHTDTVQSTDIKALLLKGAEKNVGKKHPNCSSVKSLREGSHGN